MMMVYDNIHEPAAANNVLNLPMNMIDYWLQGWVLNILFMLAIILILIWIAFRHFNIGKTYVP